MRNAVKNKLLMYQAVRRTIQSNHASWNGLAAFENAVTRFTQKVEELENLIIQKSKALTGTKTKRDKKREEISEMALYLSNALYAYASTIGDEKLRADVHYSPSEFSYSPLSVFLRIVNGLINEANDHAGDLIAYGIDQNMIDDLTLAHMEFIEISTLPRQAVVSRTVISKQIDNVIKEIDEVLKTQLDKLVVLLSKSEPTFVMTYGGARIIIDAPATRKPKVVDEDDIIDESESPPGDGDISP